MSIHEIYFREEIRKIINTLCLKKRLIWSNEKYVITTYHTIGRFSRRQTGDLFSYFSYKIGSDTSCKLSPNETICMKCQILFSKNNKKNISLSSAEFAKSVIKC